MCCALRCAIVLRAEAERCVANIWRLFLPDVGVVRQEYSSMAVRPCCVLWNGCLCAAYPGGVLVHERVCVMCACLVQSLPAARQRSAARRSAACGVPQRRSRQRAACRHRLVRVRVVGAGCAA